MPQIRPSRFGGRSGEPKGIKQTGCSQGWTREVRGHTGHRRGNERLSQKSSPRDDSSASPLSLCHPWEVRLMKNQVFLGRSLGFLQRDGPGPAMYSKQTWGVCVRRYHLPHSSKHKSSFSSKLCPIILLNIDFQGRHMWALIYKQQILSLALIL